jgi:hypothetical protein
MKVTFNRAKAHRLMSKVICSVMIAMAIVSFSSCKDDDENTVTSLGEKYFTIPGAEGVSGAIPKSTTSTIPFVTISKMDGDLYKVSMNVADSKIQEVYFGIEGENYHYVVKPSASNANALRATSAEITSLIFDLHASQKSKETWNLLISAKLSDGTTTEPSVHPLTYINDNNVDVYVLGSGNGGNMIWKNGKPIVVSSAVSSYGVADFDVDNNGIIYMIGGDPNNRAIFIKGDEPTVLPVPAGTSYSCAYSVFVVGNNVYVAGKVIINHLDSYVIVWKNGKQFYLSEGESFNVSSIYVDSKENVYVLGYYFGADSDVIVWKNGELIIKQTSPTFTGYNPNPLYTSASSIFVFNNKDVYVAGSAAPVPDRDRAILWEKGNPTVLPVKTETLWSFANSVFVADNGDVYVVGAESYPSSSSYNANINTDAVIWRNHEKYTYPFSHFFSIMNRINGYDSQAWSIYVHGKDVYAVGGLLRSGKYHQDDFDQQAALWINGMQTTLPSGKEAFKVLVRPKR